MVRIVVYKNEKLIIGVRSQGHSGFADRGCDIVCAAVSVLMINTVNSIDKLTKDEFLYTVDEKKALLDIRLKDNPGSGAVLLFRSLVLGLEAVASEYGKKFIRIDYKEV